MFFFNDTATTEISTLSLHDALPISVAGTGPSQTSTAPRRTGAPGSSSSTASCCSSTKRTSASSSSSEITAAWRSEEHTSELQSRQYLVCRLLLEKNNFIPFPSFFSL